MSLNYLKVKIYKIIPSWTYYLIAFYVKERRLKKYNKILSQHASVEKILDFVKYKRNKKIFIFGSGSSIKELSKKNYKEINKNYSIGINNWIFHDFITDLYMIELGPDEEYNEKIRLRILSLLKNNINSKFLIYLSYNGAPNLSFRNRGPTNILNMKNWMRGMDTKRVFLYEYLRPDIFKKNFNIQFLNTLKFIIKYNNKSNVISLGIGASLERVVSFSLLLGYSKIVLLGVDLLNTKVFWDDNYVNFKGIKNEQKSSGMHKTATNSNGRFPVQKSIVILDKIARKYFNSKILISTENSLLSSKLEKYKWES